MIHIFSTFLGGGRGRFGRTKGDLENGKFRSKVLLTDLQTAGAMKALHKNGYVAEPHTALASCGLSKSLKENEAGIFLSTAHPAKFKEKIEEVLGIQIFLPDKLNKAASKKVLSENIPSNYNVLKEYLLN